LNPGPPEYEAGVLLTGPRLSRGKVVPSTRFHVTIAGEKSEYVKEFGILVRVAVLLVGANLPGVPPHLGVIVGGLPVT
jgi:hypothetical protein